MRSDDISYRVRRDCCPVMTTTSAAVLCVLCCLVTTAVGFYTDTSPVTLLKGSNFKTRLQKGGYWIVEFYAPWCGHCQNLKPEYEKAAKALEGVIHVAAVNADSEKGLAQEYKVQGFPTIKLFYLSSKGNLAHAEYKGGRTASDLIKWSMEQVTKLALKSIGVKGEKKQKASSGNAGSGFYGASSDVVNLGAADFDEKVRGSADLWLVEFYAPWCGHCKNLKPEWEQAATKLKGKVHVGAVDCTSHESLCGQFGVQGFPTIKFFGSQKQEPEDYSGGRDAASIVAFATTKWSKMAPPPEVVELTETFVLEKHCTGSDDDHVPKQLCLIVFLPHILDSRAEGRKAYLKILQKVSENYKEMSYGYLWAEGGKQKKVEETFGIGGFGYPAALLYSPRKNAYSVLKAGLDYKHCVEFIDSLRHGFEKVTQIDGPLADAETTIPWDGKDATEELKDEFDLEDIMNEEL